MVRCHNCGQVIKHGDYKVIKFGEAMCSNSCATDKDKKTNKIITTNSQLEDIKTLLISIEYELKRRKKS